MVSMRALLSKSIDRWEIGAYIELFERHVGLYAFGLDLGPIDLRVEIQIRKRKYGRTDYVR